VRQSRDSAGVLRESAIPELLTRVFAFSRAAKVLAIITHFLVLHSRRRTCMDIYSIPIADNVDYCRLDAHGGCRFTELKSFGNFVAGRFEAATPNGLWRAPVHGTFALMFQ
jgi:hypothetical protein